MADQVVLNRFEIGRRLGAGGYGTVYRARDRRLERDVAVKVIETASSSGPRIKREAQAAARLNHPGIVALFEFVHHEYGPEGGRAFLVSELVDGETVRELFDRDALSDRDIAELGVDICEALDHAHDRGVVHRDIKPGNLIVPDDGNGAKLMDFGIARMPDREDLTATGDIFGTLAYMSPEQARGLETGPESDLYSLAMTLYEGFTGENPRRGTSPVEVLRTLDLPPPELGRLRPDLPPALCDSIDACLDPEPGFRPRVEDLGRALEAELTHLDREPPRAGPEPRRAGPGFRPGRIGPSLAAIGIGAATAACLALSHQADPLTVLVAFGLVTPMALFNPRLAFLTAGVGVAVWLAGVTGLPGAAFLLLIVTVPSSLLIRGDGRALALIGLGPLLGTVGLAPAVALLAGFATEWRDRAVIATATLATTALAAAASGRPLLPGTLPEVSPDWSGSISTATVELLFPVLTSPAFYLALPVWVLVAVVAGGLFGRRRRHREAASSLGRPFAGVGSGSITRLDPFENELLP
ncbi:MAG: serine/threonine protein kinase [Solirubrobacterales bacterium]|nr:serine/threonine protein kinase [Solirubrobacterales bacterium]